MDLLHVILAVSCFSQLSIARNSRYSRNPQLDPNYFLSQQELNPQVSFTYEDHLNFNYPNYVGTSHNNIEKPVDEPQEYVPPQSIGSASVPLLPPPAVPVNAVADNVPTNNGAVFLGSGSIGVVRLGNGAYALGSGALGYSDGRSQTRPSAKVPVYPRLPANPHLIPAAIPSPDPIPPPPQNIQQHFKYIYPEIDNYIQDPNSYEVLRPERAGFGTPVIRPPRPLRMHFAVPTGDAQAPSPQYTLDLPIAGSSFDINHHLFG